MIYTVLDLETTGLDHNTEQIIEIGAIRTDLHDINTLDEDSILGMLVSLEKGKYLPGRIVELTGITKKELDKYGVPLNEALAKLDEFIGDTTIVAHHAAFDLGFIKTLKPRDFFCTRTIATIMYPNSNHSLMHLAEMLDFPPTPRHHRALNDAYHAGLLFRHFIERLGSEIGMFRNKLVVMKDRPIRYMPPNAKLIV